MSADKQFDEASFGDQTRGECTLFLDIPDMKTSKSLGKHKPTNTEITSECNSEMATVVAAVQGASGQPVSYTWAKNHQGRISKVKVKPLSGKLQVTLTKAEKTTWTEDYISYLMTP